MYKEKKRYQNTGKPKTSRKTNHHNTRTERRKHPQVTMRPNIFLARLQNVHADREKDEKKQERPYVGLRKNSVESSAHVRYFSNTSLSNPAIDHLIHVDHLVWEDEQNRERLHYDRNKGASNNAQGIPHWLFRAYDVNENGKERKIEPVIDIKKYVLHFIAHRESSDGT